MSKWERVLLKIGRPDNAHNAAFLMTFVAIVVISLFGPPVWVIAATGWFAYPLYYLWWRS